jgi:hypothetical protein
MDGARVKRTELRENENDARQDTPLRFREGSFCHMQWRETAAGSGADEERNSIVDCHKC